MKPLWKLTEEFQNLLEGIYDASEFDGTVSPEIQVVLDGMNVDYAAKIEGCCKVMSDMSHRINCCKEEEQRMAAQRKSVEAHLDWLKNYVKQSLIAIGRQKMTAGPFAVAVQDNAQPSIIISGAVPDRYMREVVTTSIDKEGIRSDIEAGVPVDFATLVRGNHLRVR